MSLPKIGHCSEKPGIALLIDRFKPFQIVSIWGGDAPENAYIAEKTVSKSFETALFQTRFKSFQRYFLAPRKRFTERRFQRFKLVSNRFMGYRFTFHAPIYIGA